MSTSKKYEGMLIESARQAVAIDRGELEPARTTVLTARDTAVSEPPAYDAARIRKIRQKLALSQDLFAGALNVSTATVRAWEQGARIPDGASLRLLEIAARHPRTILQCVHQYQHRTGAAPRPRNARTGKARGGSRG